MLIFTWEVRAEAQTVELPEDEVLVSVRLRSMGGAVTGIAESASAQLYNPAAMAMRRPLQPHARIDLDLALQARDHPALAAAWQALGIDPAPPPSRRAWWQLGSDLRIGNGALAAQLRNQAWDDGENHYSAATVAVGAGWAWPTVAVGALPELVVWKGPGGRSVGLDGAMGALVAPAGLPLRVGAGFRGGTQTGETEGPGPDALRVPPEASVGASWSIGATNRAGDLGPERVQRRELSPMLLLAGDFVATGDSRGTAPILAVLAGGPVEPAPWTFGVRTGAEAWLARQQVRIRGGFTSIPGRGGADARWVVTGGTSVQLVEDPRGIPIRAVIGGEAGPEGVTLGFGIESW